ncbi:hypothetical protein ABZS59_06830 [Streptomyces flaveolus]|uniref:hypothetical protein n=1 Tax=Streptomyces flaveolus TaxID=67297 RepID=UPI0033BD857F
MTTVHTETSTERLPGRSWTVRIVGHGRSSASVTCSTAACRMPARSEDLAGLRAFAAQHAAAHAKAATVRPNAWCHCGSQRCGAHPDTKTHCAGAVLMILRHDPVMRRVWSVEEVCETCAPLIPNATVLARAERPRRTPDGRTAQPPAAQPSTVRPVVAGGFSSPAALGADDAAPVRRSHCSSRRSRPRHSGQGR